MVLSSKLKYDEGKRCSIAPCSGQNNPQITRAAHALHSRFHSSTRAQARKRRVHAYFTNESNVNQVLKNLRPSACAQRLRVHTRECRVRNLRIKEFSSGVPQLGSGTLSSYKTWIKREIVSGSLGEGLLNATDRDEPHYCDENVERAGSARYWYNCRVCCRQDTGTQENKLERR